MDVRQRSRRSRSQTTQVSEIERFLLGRTTPSTRPAVTWRRTVRSLTEYIRFANLVRAVGKSAAVATLPPVAHRAIFDDSSVVAARVLVTRLTGITRTFGYGRDNLTETLYLCAAGRAAGFQLTVAIGYPLISTDCAERMHSWLVLGTYSFDVAPSAKVSFGEVARFPG